VIRHPGKAQPTAAALQLALLLSSEHDVIPADPPVHLGQFRFQLVVPTDNQQLLATIQRIIAPVRRLQVRLHRTRCVAASCGMRQKRRNMPHDAAPQHAASGVNEPLPGQFEEHYRQER